MHVRLMIPTRHMRIGELAERSGRTVRTLHFYEELGLLDPVARTKGGFREFDDDALFRIQWIGRLQDLGCSLPDIKQFLAGVQANPTAPAMMGDLRSFYESKLVETRQQLDRLRALETEITHALTWLDTCRTCEPATEKSACRSCSDHDATAPVMVAAVQPALEAR